MVATVNISIISWLFRTVEDPCPYRLSSTILALRADDVKQEFNKYSTRSKTKEKKRMKKVYLILQNGRIFEGRAFVS
jgi:hypothetical protein